MCGLTQLEYTNDLCFLAANRYCFKMSVTAHDNVNLGLFSCSVVENVFPRSECLRGLKKAVGCATM